MSDNLKELNKHEHMSWDEYFINILKAVSLRATCNRGKAACIFVRDNIILSTGYVGSPRGFEDCDHSGHLFEETKHVGRQDLVNHCVRTVHAEQNAICNAVRLGISLTDSTVYVSFTPCRVCAMMLVQIGVKRVVCCAKYRTATIGDEILQKAGIVVDYIDTSEVKY